MIRLFRWMGWRGLVLGPVVVWVAVGGPYLALVGWAVTAYLIWRAAPGIAQDFGRIQRFGSRGRRSRSIGGF